MDRFLKSFNDVCDKAGLFLGSLDAKAVGLRSFLINSTLCLFVSMDEVDLNNDSRVLGFVFYSSALLLGFVCFFFGFGSVVYNLASVIVIANFFLWSTVKICVKDEAFNFFKFFVLLVFVVPFAPVLALFFSISGGDYHDFSIGVIYPFLVLSFCFFVFIIFIYSLVFASALILISIFSFLLKFVIFLGVSRFIKSTTGFFISLIAGYVVSGMLSQNA